MIGWRPLALLGLALVLVFAVFLDVGKAAACGDANSLLADGRFAEARSAYVKILDDASTAKCAQDGLVRVAEKRCSRAQALVDSGRPEEAKKEFAAIATTEPVPGSVSCPQALEALPTSSCPDAAALAARGEPTAAAKAYVALLDVPDAADCARAGLGAVGRARCRAARELMRVGATDAAKKELVALATTEPLIDSVARCALRALRG